MKHEPTNQNRLQKSFCPLTIPMNKRPPPSAPPMAAHKKSRSMHEHGGGNGFHTRRRPPRALAGSAASADGPRDQATVPSPQTVCDNCKGAPISDRDLGLCQACVALPTMTWPCCCCQRQQRKCANEADLRCQNCADQYAKTSHCSKCSSCRLHTVFIRGDQQCLYCAEDVSVHGTETPPSTCSNCNIFGLGFARESLNGMICCWSCASNETHRRKLEQLERGHASALMSHDSPTGKKSNQPRQLQVQQKRDGARAVVMPTGSRVPLMNGNQSKNPTNALIPAPKCKFVGLKNQGATCYLNSLLQTLFMTPEFRNAVYSYRFDEERDGPELDSTIFQLQRLFVELQFSKQASITTTALTKTFGWAKADAFIQHDVHETWKWLFKSLAVDARQSTLIDELYSGDLISCVACWTCGKQREKKEMSMDIMLDVRGQPDLESSLRHYLQPEVLKREGDRDNRYRCSQCLDGEELLSDATKSLKLRRLPHLLTFELKRFEFEASTQQCKKINSRFEFPSKIDMLEFVDSNLASEIEIPVESRSSHKYELFAVLMHSGIASGGHYYAYIKELANSSQGVDAASGAVEPDALGLWFKFNDTVVAKCTELEMQNDAFGSFLSRTGAYMLIYRQVLPSNVTRIDDAPNDIVERVERERAEANDPDNVRLTVRYLDKVEFLVAKKQWTVEQLKQAAVRAFVSNEQAKVASGQDSSASGGPFEYRIRAVNHQHVGESLVHSEIETQLQSTLSSLHFEANMDLALERRGVGEQLAEWQSYRTVPTTKKGIIQINVHVLKDNAMEYREPVSVTINRFSTTWAQLQALFEHKFRIPVAQQHFCRQRGTSLTALPPIMFFDASNDSVSISTYFENLDRVSLERREASHNESRMRTLFEETRHFINIKYCHHSDITKYDRTIRFDGRLSLQRLKVQLAELVQLPCDEFKLCRGIERLSQFEPTEFTDLDSTPERLHWADNFKLMIKKGRSRLFGLNLNAPRANPFQVSPSASSKNVTIVDLVSDDDDDTF